MAVLRIKQGASFKYNTRWHFAYNTVWQFYVQNRVAILNITQDGILRITQCGSFTYKRGCQFYLLPAQNFSSCTDLIGGCVDPTGIVEGWRRDIRLFAYGIQMDNNLAHSLVTDDY